MQSLSVLKIVGVVALWAGLSPGAARVAAGPILAPLPAAGASGPDLIALYDVCTARIDDTACEVAQERAAGAFSRPGTTVASPAAGPRVRPAAIPPGGEMAAEELRDMPPSHWNGGTGFDPPVPIVGIGLNALLLAQSEALAVPQSGRPD